MAVKRLQYLIQAKPSQAIVFMKKSSAWLAALICILLIPFAGSAYAMEPIQHWQTDNGARVYFVPARQLPMVDVQVTFSAGSAQDRNRNGLALLTNGLLAEGAGGLSSDEIAARFEDLGARFGNSVLRDMATVSLRSLSDASLMQPALKLFATVLAKPDFDAKVFERERKRMQVAIQMQQQQPKAIVKKRFYQALYGAHPYGAEPGGTQDSVDKLTPEQTRQFHKEFYVARNAVIAIVGDLDRAGAEKLAKTIIGKLPAGKAAAPLPVVKPIAKAVEQRISHPSSQSHVLMGAPGMARGDEDYFTLYVGNHILGGSGLVSRLSEEIREKRGLSYSAYSYFAPMQERGPYRFGLQTRNDQLDEALKVLRDTLKKFVDDGPTQKELVASRKNITGGFPLRIKSNSDIMGYIGMIGFYNLPLDYLDTFNRKIEAVTVKKIRDAYRRRVDPQRMITIVVGGEAEIK